MRVGDVYKANLHSPDHKLYSQVIFIMKIDKDTKIKYLAIDWKGKCHLHHAYPKWIEATYVA